MKTPKLVAIVNVTPDSFSDGGCAFDSIDALARVQEAITQGAGMIDMGAESTRPGALLLTPAEEWERLEPVISKRSEFTTNVPWSVDTRHAETALNCLRAGVDSINDVSAVANMELIDAVAQFPKAKYVLMHSLSVPADPTISMEATDPIEDLILFARKKSALLVNAGVQRENIIFDPGIGFGKTAEQSLEIMSNIEKLKNGAELPIYIGHSRKSFMKQFTNAEASERDAGTLAVSLKLAQQGVDYLRVHNISAHRQFFAGWEAMNV